MRISTLYTATSMRDLWKFLDEPLDSFEPEVLSWVLHCIYDVSLLPIIGYNTKEMAAFYDTRLDKFLEGIHEGFQRQIEKARREYGLKKIGTLEHTKDTLITAYAYDSVPMKIYDEYFAVVNGLIDEAASQKRSSPALRLRVIAMLHAYRGQPITKDNVQSIAEQYGHRDGKKLLQHFGRYQNVTNRIGSSDTLRANQEHLKVLNETIELLSQESEFEAKAISERDMFKVQANLD